MSYALTTLENVSMLVDDSFLQGPFYGWKIYPLLQVVRKLGESWLSNGQYVLTFNSFRLSDRDMVTYVEL